MHRVVGIAFAVLVLAFLTGCPWLAPKDVEYVSADTGGDGLFDIFRGEDGALEGAPETPDEADDRDVVEPDIIRRDGDTLYILNQHRGLTIVDLTTEEITGRVATQGQPRDLYFDGGYAYVLTAYAYEFTVEDGQIASAQRGRIYAVDVSDPSDPQVTGERALPGDFVASRVVGGVLYAVTSAGSYDFGYPEEGADPDAEPNGGPETTVTSLAVGGDGQWQQLDSVTFGGEGYTVLATPQSVFLASTQHFENGTEITRVDIADPTGVMALAGSVRVRGIVDDKFQMNSWEGTLRVVSSTRGPERLVYVTTVALASMEVLAELPIESALGETLFATRFDGPKAYVVTYLVVDPLFVLDLSDPTQPRILGELKVPDYSVYIEPQGDRLVALGVDDTDGGRRVSVSLFDVSEATFEATGGPQRLDVVSFGEQWSWSSAFNDVKAFTVLDDLLLVPFSGHSRDFGGFDRLQFVSYTRNDLELRGHADLSGSVLRSFEYSEQFYGVTTEALSVIDGSDLDNPQVLRDITLAEYVADIQPYGESTYVETVVEFDEGVMELRALDGNFDITDTKTVEIGRHQGTYTTGDRVAIAGIVWEDDRPRYEVAVFTLEDSALESLGHVTVNVEPFHSYYWWYGGGGPMEPGVGFGPEDERAIAPDYPLPSGADTAFVLNNTLILRCFAGDFDRILGSGDESPHMGLAYVDLEAARWTETVGLAFDNLGTLHAAGNRLYVGSRERVGFDGERPLAAYYLQEVNPFTGETGPAANVPGTYVDYDPATDRLLLREFDWMNEGGLEMSLNYVTWNGGADVAMVDSVELPHYTGDVLPAGDAVYLESYREGFQIGRVQVEDDALTFGGLTTVGENLWGSMLTGSGAQLYVGVQGAALARYNFDETPPLTGLTPVTAMPFALHIEPDRAYGPAGYAGLVQVPTP